ncbi:short-chain dehydrogenases/reductase [Cytidiella melzeri]|nr:short-chain dehydrogenases/reductase [Cytidiella melzeri]
MPSYVVTGASRGLGVSVVCYLCGAKVDVVSDTSMNYTSLPGLLELENKNKSLHVLEADVTDSAALEVPAEAVKKLTGGTLDNLINNAALSSQPRSGYQLDTYPDEEKELLEQDLLNNFTVNVIGVIKTINAFLPLIRATAAASGTPKVITLNTGVSDVDWIFRGEILFGGPYAISKTALLMAIAKYAAKYTKENIIFFSISPGLVNTTTKAPTPEELEGFVAIIKNFQASYPNWDGKPLTPEESVSSMLKVFKGLTIKDANGFVSHKGNKEWL